MLPSSTCFRCQCIVAGRLPPNGLCSLCDELDSLRAFRREAQACIATLEAEAGRLREQLSKCCSEPRVDGFTCCQAMREIANHPNGSEALRYWNDHEIKAASFLARIRAGDNAKGGEQS